MKTHRVSYSAVLKCFKVVMLLKAFGGKDVDRLKITTSVVRSQAWLVSDICILLSTSVCIVFSSYNFSFLPASQVVIGTSILGFSQVEEVIHTFQTQANAQAAHVKMEARV